MSRLEGWKSFSIPVPSFLTILNSSEYGLPRSTCRATGLGQTTRLAECSTTGPYSEVGSISLSGFLPADSLVGQFGTLVLASLRDRAHHGDITVWRRSVCLQFPLWL